MLVIYWLRRYSADPWTMIRYSDTSTLRFSNASMLRAGFFAWMLLCFDASKLRCLDAPLERARERKKERENKQGPGFQDREQQAGRQRTGRQAENRQGGREQGTMKYYYSDAYSVDPGAPVPLRLPRSRQAASYLYSHTPLAPASRGRRI